MDNRDEQYFQRELARQRWQAQLAEKQRAEKEQSQRVMKEQLVRELGQQQELGARLAASGLDQKANTEIEAQGEGGGEEILSPRASLKADRAMAIASLGGKTLKGISQIPDLGQSARQGTKLLTAKILQWLWKSAVGSYGLSLIALPIYGAIAYIGRLVEKGFCRFGHEWFVTSANPTIGTGTTTEFVQIAKSTALSGQPTETIGGNVGGIPSFSQAEPEQVVGFVGNFAEFAEGLVVGLIALLILFIILLIGVIFYFFMHPCVLVKEGLSGWGVIAELGNLACKIGGSWIPNIFYQHIK
jgi:hypothetical protein